MSHEYEDSNIMSAFFKGKIKTQSPASKLERVEVGHGIGIGHKDGSYSQYVKQLSERSREGNGLIFLGKSIHEDKETMSMNDETEKFATGDIPKLLVMFYNVINEMTLKIEWKNMDNETILEQYYQIPFASSMNYSWWDTYSTYFIGPENLEEGDYRVEISSKEVTTSGKLTESSTAIKFSVEE